MHGKFLNKFINVPGTFFDGVPGLFFEGQDPVTPPVTPPPATVSYTQEQLDHMFSERATRAEKAALEKLFQTLGVKDADELKSLYEEGKKLKDGQRTEVEKAANEKKVAEDALTAEKAAHEETTRKYTERLLKMDVLAEARKAGFREEALDDVWMLVNTSAYREKILEKNDAFVGVDKVIEEIKKVKTFWLTGEDSKKIKTPGSPKSLQKPGDGNPTPVKRVARPL